MIGAQHACRLKTRVCFCLLLSTIMDHTTGMPRARIKNLLWRVRAATVGGALCLPRDQKEQHHTFRTRTFAGKIARARCSDAAK